MNMEHLPLLILETICEFVSQFEPNRASLFAFGRTSRTCRDASKRERFSKVLLRIAEEEQFRRDLEHLCSELEKADGRKYVRLLRISSFKLTRHNKSIETSFSTFPQRPKNLALKGPSTCIWNWRPRGIATYWSIDWQPLGDFVSSLHLKDLIWAHKDQIPECVLDALHLSLPTCRLHLHTFALRSWYTDPYVYVLQDAEYKMITSPLLYSIIGVHAQRNDRILFTSKTVVMMLEGHAPNLNQVNLRLDSGGFRARNRREDLPWRGFKPESEKLVRPKPEAKAQLGSLSFELDSVGRETLEEWHRRLDLEHLRSLTLSKPITLSGLQKLAQLSQDGILDCLRDLTLPKVYEFARQPPELVVQAMEDLVSSLKHMQRLHIKDIPQEIFDAALKYHGDSLIDFASYGLILYTKQVIELQRVCTKLKQLDIEVLRTEGDEVEAQIYRTLGSIRTLEHLTVILNTTSYRYIGRPDDYCLSLTVPQHVEKDPVLRRAFNDKVKAVLRNAAIDQTLATSIFTELLTANAHALADLPPTLNAMNLEVRYVSALDGVSIASSPAFGTIQRQLGRDWYCERDPRNTHRHLFRIEDLTEADVFALTSLEDDEDFRTQLAYQVYKDVPKEIWPEAGERWMKEWVSLPLKGEFGSDMEKLEFRKVELLDGTNETEEEQREDGDFSDYGESYYGEL